MTMDELIAEQRVRELNRLFARMALAREARTYPGNTDRSPRWTRWAMTRLGARVTALFAVRPVEGKVP
jgi:hypothetical protein